jgi:hypothetical protein
LGEFVVEVGKSWEWGSLGVDPGSGEEEVWEADEEELEYW